MHPTTPSAADLGAPPAIAPVPGTEAVWPPGTEVGVIEGCTGRRMHGSVALIEAGAVLVWIPDLRHSPPKPCAPHGYLIPMSPERIASGAMWAEPLPASLTVPVPTIGDVEDYWVWARNVGAVATTSANSYISALRAVFVGQGAAMATAVADVELDTVLAAFAARPGRSARTLRQYTTSARSAVRNYRIQRQYALAAHTGAPVWAGARGCDCSASVEAAR
jgi:hypothetical protein